jgi:cell surface heme-binding protein Shp
MKKGIKKILCGFAVALVIMTGVLAAFPGTAKAATHGIYTVTATPYYAHPVTGVIEDSGQNPGIGQGMTESVLEKQALLEVDEDGNHFVTARFFLMDNIENMSLSVQKDAKSEFVDAAYTIMKEDMEEATSDLRFAVSDANAIIRATFYVVPMGRDVVFYMTFSDAVSGSGDFVTSIEVDESIASEQQAQSTQAPAALPTAAASPNVAAAAIDVDGGLTVYENSDNAEEQVRDTTILFIVSAIVIIAAIGIAGFVYYKKKVDKAAYLKQIDSMISRSAEQDGGKRT